MGMLDSLREALTGSSDKRTATGDYSGKGGRARKGKMDEQIDEASGTPPADQDQPSNAGRQAQSTDSSNGY